MYVPPAFRLEDETAIARLIADHAFGLLITAGEDGLPVATHLPLLFDRDRNVLEGHVAKANPQWRLLEEGRPALAVFSGPHAYVSPSWYAGAPNVPTWNYAAIHVTGTARLVTEPAAMEAMQRRLVARFEEGFAEPWRMDLPADYQAAMLKGIVCFEIAIERIEAKAKMSQNRKGEDRDGAIAALAASPRAEDRDVAAMMRDLAEG